MGDLNGNVFSPQRRRSWKKKRQRRMDGFVRSILSIQKNYMKTTTASPQPRKKRS